MPVDSRDEQDSTLPPPGRRWGTGAQSVLPYLTRSLQARPASAPEQARDGRPRAEPRTGSTDRSGRAE